MLDAKPKKRSSHSSGSSFPLNDKEVLSLVSSPQKRFSRSIALLVGQARDDIQNGNEREPIELGWPYVTRLSARYIRCVQEATSAFADELSLAIGNRFGIGNVQKTQIIDKCRVYANRRLSSSVACEFFGNILTNIERRISNREEAVAVLVRNIVQAANNPIVLSDAVTATERARTVFGPARISTTAVKLPPKVDDYSHHFNSANLTERQEQIASLRYERRMKVSEIARYLGVHRKTVQESLAVSKLRIDHARSFERRAKGCAITRPGNLG